MSSIVQRAFDVAIRAHHGQVRDGADAVPYIAHPVEVVKILQQHGVCDPRILAAAWLHDVVEDTPVTLADLASFGVVVVDWVDRLTKTPHQPMATYYNRIWDSPEATLIKIADRISNLRTYHVKGEAKLQRYLQFTERDYTTRDAYGLWDTLQDTVREARARVHTQ